MPGEGPVACYVGDSRAGQLEFKWVGVMRSQAIQC